MRPALLLVVVLPLLAACGDPRDRCVREATAELRTIEALIAETETTIARGFTTVREPGVRTRLDICIAPNDPFLFCTRAEPTVTERPVAIDRAAERRKLATLQARRAELQAETRAAIAACEARHPRR